MTIEEQSKLNCENREREDLNDLIRQCKYKVKELFEISTEESPGVFYLEKDILYFAVENLTFAFQPYEHMNPFMFLYRIDDYPLQFPYDDDLRKFDFMVHKDTLYDVIQEAKLKRDSNKWWDPELKRFKTFWERFFVWK